MRKIDLTMTEGPGLGDGCAGLAPFGHIDSLARRADFR